MIRDLLMASILALVPAQAKASPAPTIPGLRMLRPLTCLSRRMRWLRWGCRMAWRTLAPTAAWVRRQGLALEQALATASQAPTIQGLLTPLVPLPPLVPPPVPPQASPLATLIQMPI